MLGGLPAVPPRRTGPHTARPIRCCACLPACNHALCAAICCIPLRANVGGMRKLETEVHCSVEIEDGSAQTTAELQIPGAGACRSLLLRCTGTTASLPHGVPHLPAETSNAAPSLHHLAGMQVRCQAPGRPGGHPTAKEVRHQVAHPPGARPRGGPCACAAICAAGDVICWGLQRTTADWNCQPCRRNSKLQVHVFLDQTRSLGEQAAGRQARPPGHARAAP